MSDTITLNYSLAKKRYAEYALFYDNKSSDVAEIFQFDTGATINDNLNKLAIIALDSANTTAYLHSFNNIFLDLVSRWISNSSIESKYIASKGLKRSIKGSVALSSLGRIVPLAQETAPLAEFFLEKYQIFNQLERLDSADVNEVELQDILIAFYRLIHQDRSRFIKFLSPEVLTSILTKDYGLHIKYLSIQLLAFYLNLAEKAKNDMLKLHVPETSSSLFASFENSSKINYLFISIVEAKRISNYLKISSNSNIDENKSTDITIKIDQSQLSSLVVPVCGLLIPKIHFDETLLSSSLSNELDLSKEFIPTERSVEILKNLAYNVQHSQPVMLVGGAGSGKTFLIDILSKYLSCDSTIVKIHLGEQTDAKLLLGTYTSGERPGTFEWRSGVLTTAVKEGRWVLIEDIDKAPTEVLSVLLSLLEKRELTIPSRGEVIRAANGFQLIATMRSSNDLSKWKIPEIIGLRLWKTLNLLDPSREELSQILTLKFPLLKKLAPSFLNLYEAIINVYQSKSFLSLCKGSHPRAISIRDLMKFCKRVNTLFLNNGIKSSDHLLQSSIYDNILAEAVDCFASAISEQSALEPLIKTIGEQLQIATSRINLFVTNHKPIYEDYDDKLILGRAHLNKANSALYSKKRTGNNTSFARTQHSMRLMEKIGVAVQMTEPVLLVGETGTGKTTVVQQVAKQLNKQLTVINVSQQTEAGDLLGGFKPVNTKSIAVPLQETFQDIFHSTFSAKKNERFEEMLNKCFNRSQWKNVVKLWNEAVRLAFGLLEKKEDSEQAPKKKRRLNSNDKLILIEKWKEFQTSVKNFEIQAATMDKSFVFNFVEGSLVKAVRNGDWLLLDEINLASPDTLESISDLLSDSNRSLLLSEKGDVESIPVHPEFRIFACMNPATDIGKRDLPISIRSRFTELYVHSPDSDIVDLLAIIDKYISRFAINDEWIGTDIADLYLEAKKLSETNQIVDGANQRPHFSIRTLTRTLLYVVDIVSIYGLRRSLYEGFSMSFLTLLDQKSEKVLKPLIEKYTIGRLKNAKSVLKQTPPMPPIEKGEYVQFKHYWMKKGVEEVVEQPNYIITPFVEKNLLNLVRATSGERFPILVQGPTSSGKTSMIKYLADITGHKFVRINNHEHTDLQEYLGTYVSDDTGKLSFKEGVLVEALRKGYWLVLDELNLAPTDVLEALNRLLDDNRELFIPETQEVVHPHPDFMLFATQNPPGLYGGRKVLSRAFRNRFLELHFDDIPQDELETILRDRCQIAPTYAKRIVDVYIQLSTQRQSSRIFEQKNSFATLRDLFRWGMREAVGYEELAANGYMLLAERVRKPEEKIVVKQVLEKVMKVKLNMEEYYNSLENKELLKLKSSVVWTKAMRRLAVLISTSFANNEPVLLVGETGCGKTTVCQLLAHFNNKKLITVNAHQNTETGDLLGAQRPVRNKSESQQKLAEKIKQVLAQLNVESTALSLDDLLQEYDSCDLSEISEGVKAEIKSERDSLNILFEWSDGPLIQALNTANYFLLDEISLADDSVLERLNSVLEPERSLLLAEKGSENSFIVAKDGFQFLATMNPGGDYGKKELSPALRNRFTEIWVPSMEDFNDVKTIVESKLLPELAELSSVIVKFSENFGKMLGAGNATSGVISLRDILAWVEFINSAFEKGIPAPAAVLHGAAMVFIDALGTNNTAHLAESEEKLANQKLECVKELSDLMKEDLSVYYKGSVNVLISKDLIKAGIFTIHRKEGNETDENFGFEAPTTAVNAMRVIRAMQVSKPILLEGSPGVGKTSLVSALAKATGNKLTRINLSEQTDLVDLFGSDAPAEGGKTGEFVWKDAPFLRAMQKGEWVLLDEMNLASQSVLEGLNACLDHRGEAYIPELDRSFTCHPNFVVIAAQNPQYQGGGRKGLPKSFVNRFTVVYVETLSADDLLIIAHRLYPNIDADVCSKMIKTMSVLEEDVSIKKQWGSAGGPWEFNLRDTLRWLQLFDSVSISNHLSPSDFADLIVCKRFRNESDQQKAQSLIDSIFQDHTSKDSVFSISEEYFQAGKALLKRSNLIQHSPFPKLAHLQTNTKVLESSALAVQNNWPLILVGPTNSGKTELVRYLANISGNKVLEFSMNSDVDSMDILGGYEQVDLTRKVTDITAVFINQLKTLVGSHLTTSTEITETDLSSLELLRFLTSTQLVAENFGELFSRFNSTLTQLQKVPAIKDTVERIFDISEELGKKKSVQFEWFDGLLVKAVQNGNWLILDNANLCSPSVLDRLNSLLEINGSLMINECSMTDGQARVLKPHPNFRLFLTVDPKFGELSRAMRNRGVEIYVESLDERSTPFDKLILGQSMPEMKDEEDEDINIESLSLLSQPVDTPLTRFVDSGDSFTRAFALSLDVLNTKHLTVEFSAFASSILPFWSYSSLNDLGEVIFNSKEFNDSQLFQSVKDINELLNFEINQGISSKIYELYKEISERANVIVGSELNFSNNQSLLPLWNIHAELSLEKDKNLDPKEAISWLLVFSNVFKSLQIMERLKVVGLNGKLNELNYVELCSAMTHGRNIKGNPPFNTYVLLGDILEFTINTVKSVLKDNILNSGSIFQLLMKLFAIWTSLYDASKTQDISKFRVYQDLVSSWLESAGEFMEISNLKESINKFGKNLILKSGWLMTDIWEAFRGQYPSSQELWNDYDKLLEVAAEVDSVSFQQYSDTAEIISTIRSSLLNLERDIISSETSDFTQVFETIQSTVNKLKDISNKFITKRSHNLKECFHILFNIVLAEGKYTQEDLLILSNQAGLSTLSLMEIEKKDIYHPVFNTLWNSPSKTYKSLVSELFTSKSLTTVLKSCTNYQEFSADQLDQTVKDLEQFSKQLLNHSNDVISSKVKTFKTWALNLARRIVSLEIKSEIPSDADLLESMNLIENEHVQTVNKKFIVPAVQLLNNGDDINSLGQAFILLAVGLIQLYVPDSPYDPAIEEYVVYDCYDKRKATLESTITSIQSIKNVYFGDDSLYLEQFVNDQDLQKPSKPQVYRSQLSLDNLFEEWNSFMVSTLGSDLYANLEKLLAEKDLDMFTKTTNVLQQNSTNFIERLDVQFKQLSDVNDIFKGYIYMLKFGFDLLLEFRKSNEVTYSIDPLSSMNFSLFTSGVEATNFYSNVKNLLKTLDAENAVGEQLLCFCMRVGMNISESEIETKSDILQQVFQTLYYRWTLRRMKKEQEAAENATVFKFNDTQDAEDDFKTLFPDYEEFLDVSSDATTSSSVSLEDEYFNIAEIYMDSFLSDHTEKLSKLVSNGAIISKVLASEPSIGYSNNDSSNLASIILNLSNSINDAKLNVKSTDLDFYRGYSVPELKRSIEVVSKLLVAVNSHLEEFPDHATLQTLSRISNEYLLYSVKTPIAKLLQKIEQILTFVAEWEKYASKRVSLSINNDELTALVVSWRRLELSSWKGLFETEDEAVKKANSVWWFNLFETIIVPLYNEEPISTRELVSSLNLFLTKCNYGQFEYRLNLVNAFIKHISLLPNSTRLFDALNNVLSYYRQFLPMVQEHINSQRKKLQKDIEEVILLASWKDVNIDSLKQSSRRSHQSLYKIVHKYRAVLSADITATIEQGLSSATKVFVARDKVGSTTNFVVDIESAQEICGKVQTWRARPSHLKNIDMISLNMKVYNTRTNDKKYPELYSFATDLVEEMERLKNETPSQFNDDTKKEIAALKTQKRKLLSDTIRELRRMGLKIQLREDIHKVQASATAILSRSKSFNGTVAEATDAYFFRIIDLLPRLRASVSAVADDVPPADAEKGLAAAEHLMYLMINNKKVLSKLGKNYKRLSAIQNDLEMLFTRESTLVSDESYISNESSVQSALKWLPNVFDYCSEIVSISNQLSASSVDGTLFGKLRSEFIDLKRSIEGSLKYSSTMYDNLKKLETFIHNLKQQVLEWKVVNPSFNFIGDCLLSWVEKIDTITTKDLDTEEEDKSSTIEEFETMLKKITTKVLFVFQKVKALQELKPITEEDDLWLTETQEQLNNMIKAIHFESVVGSIEQVLRKLSASKFNETESTIIRSLFSFTGPVIMNYFNLITLLLNKYRDNFIDISRSTYVLSTSLYNLCKDGFCSPQPPEESKDNDNLQDGTGLGDGEGAENNSKDVEDDEDLTENAQEPNKEKDENKEDDENDDAVDIEGDMAGDLEDASDQDDDEDDEDKDDDEKELDEEIDDLDDLDPNAVDDKMWNEEAQESSKEKESETMPEDSKNDDVKAQEDDQEPSKQEKPNQDDQDQDQGDDEDKENDEDGEDEEDVGEQDDEVKNENGEDLEQNVPEADALDLPEDLNLDEEGDDEEDEDKENDKEEQGEFEDGLDDDDKPMEDDQKAEEEQGSDEEDGDQEGDVEMNDEEDANEEDAEQEENPEGVEADNQANEEDNEEVNPEEEGVEGVEEDEELKKDGDQDKPQEDDQEDQGEDGDQMEGLEGAETGNNDEIDQETAVEQQSGDKGEGAQTEVQEEEENIGASGLTNNQQEEENKQEDQVQEDARNDARESLKQLGDSLKEFHRRHQEIQEASEKDETVEESANQRIDEFEHVEGENTETNTQALGSANKEQVSKIDEEMAIDDDEEEVKKEEESIEDNNDGAEEVDEDMEEQEDSKQQEESDDFNGKSKGGFIGERKIDNKNEDEFIKSEFNEEDEDEDENEFMKLLKPEVVDDEIEYRTIDEARDLWRQSELDTQELSASLCEQLRLILEPTLSTKLRGDYKTGKRLNMKRIISYIASDFRKDKIWLRRTKPSKRQYQIMIAVDDSKSMSESKSVQLAFESICLVSKALTQLESGELSVVKFGGDVKMVHPFDKQFTPEVGSRILQKFGFEQTRTDIKKLVYESLEMFNSARTLSNNDLWQLEIIISDGVCEDHETIQRLVRRAREEKIMLVFVIIDGINANESIMDMSQVKYVTDASGNMNLQVDKYLDTFPFEFYVVVHDISDLPKMLSLILRQYFSEMAAA